MIITMFLFDYVFFVRPSYLRNLFKVRHVTGALIMTYSMSMLVASYGYSKNDIPCGGSNPRPAGHESSAIINYKIGQTSQTR